MKHRASRLVSLHGFEQNLFKLSVNSQIIWVLRGRITFSISSMVPTKESRSCRIGWDLWLFESVCNNPSPSLPEDARVRSVLQVLPVQETCPDIGFVQALACARLRPIPRGKAVANYRPLLDRKRERDDALLLPIRRTLVPTGHPIEMHCMQAKSSRCPSRKEKSFCATMKRFHGLRHNLHMMRVCGKWTLR